MNGLFYEYYYNGAGVAVADFNNDGYEDIFLVSNLHSNKLYLNSGKLRFKDVSNESGVSRHHGFATGVTIVDINCDGLADIYLSNSGKLSPELMKNELFVNQGLDRNGVPVFSEKSADYGLDISLCSTQAAFFDFDRDNDLDMFLINHFPDIYNFNNIDTLSVTKSGVTGDRLYENRNGKFFDVSDKAGLVNNRLCYCLGLGVGNDYSGRDYLYLNTGKGKFRECLNESLGHVSFSSMGNFLGDFNNDGWCDIVTLDMMAEDNYGKKAGYSSIDNDGFRKLVNLGMNHQYMYNTLQVNNGVTATGQVPVCSDIAMLAGVSATDWSWGPLLFDMDNDGLKDLFIANGINRDFINNDYLSFFEKQYRELVVSRRIKRDDFVRSVLERMPQRKRCDYFFRNNGDLTFDKLNGTRVQTIPTCSNGSAYADFDNDGDMDLVINNSGGPSFIYRNNTRELGGGNFLEFKLEGPPGNPSGIGTRIILSQNNRIQVQDQYLTRGYLSAVSPVLHFGTGAGDLVSGVQVIWPDGKEQIIRDVRANQVLVLKYSEASGKHDYSVPSQHIFSDITFESGLAYRHIESDFDDFGREPLLLHRMSDTGPVLTVADVDGDGLEDFFIGGAKGHPGRLYLQAATGFKVSPFQPWAADSSCEDTGCLFFDADNDGRPDLYVAGGSNEFEKDSPCLAGRLYMNKGSGTFIKSESSLPDLRFSCSCVRACDFDGDGDLDLFTGGRQLPGNYPLSERSHILRNDSGRGQVKFTDITTTVAPGMSEPCMVTDACFSDLNGDGTEDLIICGEWMPLRIFINRKGTFTEVTGASGTAAAIGWWNCVVAGDFDRDGDNDLIAGNLGLNCRYRATPGHPFELYSGDFDNNGTTDLVPACYYGDTLFPLTGFTRAAKQLPFISGKYRSFDAYARANLSEIYGKNLKTALHLKATEFATCYFENTGEGQFRIHRLDNQAQISPVCGIIADDVDGDGNTDLVLGGNMFGTDIETPRQDAGIGLYMKGDESGDFTPVSSAESGLLISGDVRCLAEIRTGREGKKAILAAVNNDYLKLIGISSPPLSGASR
jgi:hypothetical protein